MNTLKQQFLRYWLAMNESAIQSAAHAGKAWLATAAAHAVADVIPALDLKQFLAVLGFFYLMAILDWLAQNPLPDLVARASRPCDSETHAQDPASAAALPREDTLATSINPAAPAPAPAPH